MNDVASPGGLMAVALSRAIARAGVGEQSRADLAMERYADGDESAFSDLYDELAPRLFAFALRETHSRSAAEDAVQQTLLQIHCARARFVRGAAVRPWAYAIARRLLIDGYRRAAHEARLDEAGAHDDEGADRAHGATPEEALDRRRREAELEQDLRHLPPAHRDAFCLVKLEGLSVAEAAEVLGITSAMVKIRTFRAAEALRAADARRRRTP